MARIGKRRSVSQRVDPDFKKWVDDMSRLKSFQEKCEVKPTRITQAIFNLRNKYPIDEEIKVSKLGKWKSR